MSDLTCFVINLDGSTDRMQATGDALDRAGIAYNRFAAVDGRGKDPSSFAAYNADKALSFYGRALTTPEIGCYLSHLGCVDAFLQSDAELCLVLEDDVNVAPDTGALIDQLQEFLTRPDAPKWELVNLGKPTRLFQTRLGQVGKTDVMAAHYVPTTTTALLWNRAGAAAFLATRHAIYAPVDHFLRHLFVRRGTCLALQPAPLPPRGDPSIINAQLSPASRKPAHFLLREARRQAANYGIAAYRKFMRR